MEQQPAAPGQAARLGVAGLLGAAPGEIVVVAPGSEKGVDGIFQLVGLRGRISVRKTFAVGRVLTNNSPNALDRSVRVTGRRPSNARPAMYEDSE